MFDRHALGLTGRTRGINHIGQVFTVHSNLRVVLGLSTEIESVEFQHLQCVRKRQSIPKPALRQQQLNTAVPDHVPQPLLRILRVQRHISSASFQNRQQTHHHLNRTFYRNTHPHFGLHAQCDQTVRQTISPAVELRIAEMLITKYQSGRCGIYLYLSFDQTVYRFAIRISRTVNTPCPKLLSFRLTQQFNLAHRLLRPFGQRGQHTHIVRRHALNRRRFKQFFGIGKARFHSPITQFAGVQGQLKLSFGFIEIQALHA